MNEINDLVKSFEKCANQEIAEGMSAYMRNLFPFLGLKSDLRKEKQKFFINFMSQQSIDEIVESCRLLWEMPHREYQYVACELLVKNKSKIRKSDLAFLEEKVCDKSWWDSVDSIAPNLFGFYFQKYPEMLKPTIQKWIDGDNIWLQRSAILYQLKYKQLTDKEFLGWIVTQFDGSKEFFINKAIGWALREYSKTNPEWVSDFVAKHRLSNLSQKEALKVINKKNQK
ncbi:MAG: DNA alkylation repair protein [Bacteroidales bacterium]|nr:DNA alkylation repair protein [Bacteroidales bacterium]